ncbi:MAG TPA: carboxypeptidase-like regulatory domain-containing protein [Gemmatimonadales bacterium]|nr:carboxypeptidase-like regulatory domain-containing protein [Gemmatimonadales bacterium]
MRATTLLCLVTLVAACKSSTAPGNSGPYACEGQALPTTAPSTITVSGTVADFSSSGVAGARVDAFKTGTAGSIDSATTDAQGHFALTVPTGGVPLDGFIKASKTGYLDTYAYPSAPLPASTSITLTVITSSQLNTFASLAGATPIAGNGSLAIRPVDCTEAVATGATVSTSPPATPYPDGNGNFFEFNLAPGSVTVSAKYQSHTFRSHPVVAFADAVTITIIAPGPVSPPE